MPTPFLAHLEPWQAASRKSKISSPNNTYVRQFAAEVDQAIERLTGGHVQKWIEQQVKINVPGTVRFKLVGLRKYWSWMQSHELVPTDRNPFAGRKINGQQTAAARAESKRTRFDPLDIPALWQAAELPVATHDLAAAIRLAISPASVWRKLAKLRGDGINLTAQPACATSTVACKRMLAHATSRSILTSPPSSMNWLRNATGTAICYGQPAAKNGAARQWLGTRSTQLRQAWDTIAAKCSIRCAYTARIRWRRVEAPLNVIHDLMRHEGKSDQRLHRPVRTRSVVEVAEQGDQAPIAPNPDRKERTGQRSAQSGVATRRN